MLQLPTGGGKTVTFVELIKKYLLNKKRVILLAHREELILQAWNTLHKNKILAGVIKGDQPVNYSFPAQVASIQTIIRRKNLPEADLIIIDEAHHAQSDNSYGEIINKYPNAKILGVTATPYRLSGHGFTDVFEKLIQSVTFKELVNCGYLTPLKYLVGSIPDLSHIKVTHGDYNERETAKVMEMAPLVESYMQHCKGMAGVVFAVNVEHSLDIVRKYNEAGVPARHLDANTPDQERRQILSNFKNGLIKIISNVGIITEGFDFPNMEFVQLARPTKSLSMYLQMVGRVTRVDNDVISGIQDDDARRFAVSCSRKPFGFILDNAGTWQEHGLPEQEFNWELYFEGTKSKKREITDERIEIIEFIAEDDNGQRVRTPNPTEIEGMKLVEINKHIKERVINLNSMKEFDKLFVLANRLKTVQKKGFFAFYKFMEYCNKKNLFVSYEIWDYIKKRMVDDRKKKEAEINEIYDLKVKRFGNDGNDNYRNQVIMAINKEREERIARIKIAGLPEKFIETEKNKYFDKIEKEKLSVA